MYNLKQCYEKRKVLERIMKHQREVLEKVYYLKLLPLFYRIYLAFQEVNVFLQTIKLVNN